jgi:hypothetical protein
MTIGGSLFLFAVGAILRYAVQDRISGVELATAGLILMVVGAIGLVLAIYFTFVRGDRYADEAIVDERRIRRPL